jgi:ubiquinone/menaquinone biosynthesis C-methylase UbiE/uncharacterized protein YbaR (Trm112 family)
MIQDVVPLLLCPTCHSSRLKLVPFVFDSKKNVQTGIIACTACKAWYAIDKYVLEFLPPDSTYIKDKNMFYRKYKNRLSRLGLRLTLQPGARGPKNVQQAHFDWYASNTKQNYDSYSTSNFWKSVDRYVFGLLRPLIKKNALLLDMGCGQGRSTFQVSDLPIRIVAFDISKEMIRLAVHKYQHGHFKANMTFIVADASAMPFKHHCFDVVLSYGVLHHLRNAASTCKEIARIVKSRGGTFFALENNKSIFRTVFDLMQYVRPIWYEEAGSSPLISGTDLKYWFKGTSVKIRCQTQTYLSPHFVVMLPLGIAQRLLNFTDTICSKIPWLNKQGGLIVAIGKT